MGRPKTFNAIALAALAAALFLAGCASPVQGTAEATAGGKAKVACIQECLSQKAAGEELSNGPCLSNGIQAGWVCDVAHSPRQPADNDPANQCPAYGKTANHFVEVDSDCNFIRAA